MTASVEQFARVVTADATGVYEHGRFCLSHELRAPMRSITFTLCEIAQKRISVFIVDLPIRSEQRYEIAAATPSWLDGVVFAEVPRGSKQVIEAELAAPSTSTLTLLGFAVAVVMQSHGAFKSEVKSCVVRFAQATVAVTIDFNWDSESFFGDAAIQTSQEA